MLIRISLILAIIAGLAVGVINFTKIKQTITDLRTHLQEQTDRAVKAETSLAKTTAELKKTQTALDETKKNLDDTKKQLDVASTKVNELSAKADKLQSDLTAVQKELSDAKIDLDIYRSVFPTTTAAVNAGKQMKAMEERVAVVEDEKKVLQRQLVRVNAELDVYRNPDRPIPLPASLIGKVLVADPKWDFVILNVGADQGALNRGEMLVNRDGHLVAKVRITSVQKDRCIANVLPGWKLGDVLEGDQVIPAYPSES
jgi:cell shape-determining protein MreC